MSITTIAIPTIWCVLIAGMAASPSIPGRVLCSILYQGDPVKIHMKTRALPTSFLAIRYTTSTGNVSENSKNL